MDVVRHLELMAERLPHPDDKAAVQQALQIMNEDALEIEALYKERHEIMTTLTTLLKDYDHGYFHQQPFKRNNRKGR